MLLTREEIAAIVGVHPMTIKRASQSGKLASHRLGHKLVRYLLSDVNSWLQNSRYEATSPTN
jgi:excisionase family DNA binding protein